jgi:hypothetical protein
MALRKGSVSNPAWEDDMLSHRVGDLILISVAGSLGDDLRVRDWGDPGGELPNVLDCVFLIIEEAMVT